MRNKTCMICKMGIKIPGDKYVKVHDYDEKDVLLSKGYYHRSCYIERLNGTSDLKRLQEQAFSFIVGAKKKMGIEEPDMEIVI